MKVANIVNVNAEHRLFEISSSESGRSCYQVRICSQPSSSCPDFGKQGSKVFCKHILFVLMFVLDVSDVNVLDTLAFETEEIVHILHKTDVDPQFKRNKSNKGTRRDRWSLQHILSNHENVNDEQICTIQLKENRSAKCSGLSCKKYFSEVLDASK